MSEFPAQAKAAASAAGADVPEPTEAVKDRRVIDAKIDELAGLDLIDYEMCRRAEANKLGFRPTELDKMVTQRRPKSDTDQDGAGSGILFPEIEPWPQPVDGAVLLDEIVTAIGEYAITPKDGAESVALWVFFAHSHEAHLVSPILMILAPERDCGKTVLLETASWLVPKPLPSSGTSAAVVFRVIEEHQPTLLTDEMDTLGKETLEAIRGIYNAGHTRRFAKVMRNVPIGDGYEVRSFSTWSPKALAQIGRPPPTMLSRGIQIRMNRKPKSQMVKRLPPNGTPELHALARKCARWAVDNISRLNGVIPDLPEGLGNRLGDNWMPLINIADVVGGSWPDLARRVAMDQAGIEEEASLGEQALEDINATFIEQRATKLGSQFICEELHKLEHRKWPEYGRQRKPITPTQLASLLNRYGIGPKDVRPDPGGISGKNAKGYDIADFKKAFSSYLPRQGVTPRQTAVTAGFSGFDGVTENEPVTPENRLKAAVILDCHTVTPPEGGSGGDTEDETRKWTG